MLSGRWKRVQGPACLTEQNDLERGMWQARKLSPQKGSESGVLGIKEYEGEI